MTMPDNDHKPLYSSLSKAVMKEVVIAKPAKSAMHNGVNDNAVEDDEANLPKLTICEQTCLDANRASFVFKRYGNLPVKCGLGADSANIDTVSALHDVCDHDSSVTQTASKLIHQGVIATLLIPMLLKHFNSAEQHIRYLSSRDSEPKIHESTTKQRDPVIQRSVYTVSECDDGALEFGLTHQEKIHKWILNDDTPLDVNRGPQWEGDLSDANFGIHMSVKIKISKADLKRGHLDNVEIIEPLSFRFRLQPIGDNKE